MRLNFLEPWKKIDNYISKKKKITDYSSTTLKILLNSFLLLLERILASLNFQLCKIFIGFEKRLLDAGKCR